MQKEAWHEGRKITSLQRLSYSLGRNLAVFGWMLFAVALFFTFLFDEIDKAHPAGMFFLGFLFKVSGLFIVSGWLLLRFADGLFPFGRRMFEDN